MSTLFDECRSYAGKWSPKNSRSFTDEEKKMVSRAEVVASNYGSSVCFHMVAGDKRYIPLSTNSSATVGETVDLNKAKILTLEKEGEMDITRIDI